MFFIKLVSFTRFGRELRILKRSLLQFIFKVSILFPLFHAFMDFNDISVFYLKKLLKRHFGTQTPYKHGNKLAIWHVSAWPNVTVFGRVIWQFYRENASICVKTGVFITVFISHI